MFLLVRLFFLSVDLVSAGPICRQCLDAANTTECITRTVECWDNEVKHLEKKKSFLNREIMIV